MKNVVIYLATLIAISYLFKRIEKEADKKIVIGNNGEFFLRPTNIYGQFGIISLFGSLFFFSPLFGAFGYTFEKIGALEIFIITVAIILLTVAVYLMAFGFKHRIYVDNATIKSFSLWRKPIEIKWEEIQKVIFSGNTLYLRLLSPNKKIRIHAHMIGFKKMRELVEEKTRLEIQKEGTPNSWQMP